jgi:hypothetical protein
LIDLTCRQCGSDNTQKLSIINQSGTTSTKTTGAAIGGFGGHLGAGLSSSDAKSVNKLAEQHAPPILKSAPWVPGCLGIIGVILMFSYPIIGVPLFVGCILWGGIATKAHKQELWRHAEAMTVWDKQFLCLRCGCVFSQPAPAL